MIFDVQFSGSGWFCALNLSFYVKPPGLPEQMVGSFGTCLNPGGGFSFGTSYGSTAPAGTWAWRMLVDDGGTNYSYSGTVAAQ